MAYSLNAHETVVPSGIPPERADRLLLKLLAMPAWQLRDAFERKDVKRNGKRIAPDAILLPGDRILVYSPFAKRAPLQCVYQDSEYAVIHKMPGLPTQGPVSVETIASEQLGVPLKACHRLDVQTGGLLLFSKTERALQEAERAFYERRVSKTYRALVRGLPSPAEATLSAYLIKDADASRVRVLTRKQPGAVPIETRYRVVEPGRTFSRLEVDLLTGRTHQIRAHLSHAGHPVLGDDKYGDRAFNRAHAARKQMLWAVKLTLWDGRSFSVREGF